MSRPSIELSPGSSKESSSALGLCTCGNVAIAGRPFCLTCIEREYRNRRYSQQASAGLDPIARYRTPPPNQMTSPRRSLDVPLARTRQSFTSHAFDDPTASMASLAISGRASSVSSYSTSRSTSSHYSASEERSESRGDTRRTSSVNPSEGLPAFTHRASSTSSNQDIRPVHAEYAPMAAGFLRLKAKDSPSPDPSRRGRARPSTDLGARMFEGAA